MLTVNQKNFFFCLCADIDIDNNLSIGNQLVTYNDNTGWFRFACLTNLNNRGSHWFPWTIMRPKHYFYPKNKKKKTRDLGTAETANESSCVLFFFFIPHPLCRTIIQLKASGDSIRITIPFFRVWQLRQSDNGRTRAWVRYRQINFFFFFLWRNKLVARPKVKNGRDTWEGLLIKGFRLGGALFTISDYFANLIWFESRRYPSFITHGCVWFCWAIQF